MQDIDLIPFLLLFNTFLPFTTLSSALGDTGRNTDAYMDGQSDRQMDRQTDRLDIILGVQKTKGEDTQTERQTDIVFIILDPLARVYIHKAHLHQ